MLFDGTLQTWELVMLLSFIPWLLAGPISCLSQKPDSATNIVATIFISIGMVGSGAGLAAIVVGAIKYMPHASIREILSVIIFMVIMAFAYFVATTVIMFLGIFVSALILPYNEDEDKNRDN